MKTVCIYHSIDLDGWMSAAIVKYWFEQQDNIICENKQFAHNTLDFIGYNYGQPIPDLSEYDKVIICDISLHNAEMSKLFEDKELIWIDHHISAINESKSSAIVYSYSDAKGIRDTKYAACELTWMYFFPNTPMPEIVRLLGRYDCFGHKGTDEEVKVLEFQYGARQLITNYTDAYKQLQNSLSSPEVTELNIHGRGISIYQYLCVEAKQVYSNGFPISFVTPASEDKDTMSKRTCKFICINRERFNPDNFEIDYGRDGYDGVACFHYANKKWNFSLYSNNQDVDCSLIAKQYGGGGHKGAAGFTTQNINQFIN